MSNLAGQHHKRRTGIRTRLVVKLVQESAASNSNVAQLIQSRTKV
jgi:hypothetical protein